MDEKNVTDVKSAESLPKTDGETSVTLPADEKPVKLTFLTKIGKKLKLNKKALGLVAIIIPLIIVAGGVYAYQTVYLSPENVVKRSFDKMEDVKTFGYSGKVSATFSSNEAGGSLVPLFSANAITASFTGSADVTEKDSSKGDVAIEVKSGTTTFAQLQLRNFGKILYVNANNLSGLDAILGGQGIFNEFTNQWIRLDPEELDKLTGQASKMETPDIDTQAITKLMDENNPLKITQQLPEEELDGQAMYHYAFGVDKEKLKTFMAKFQEIVYKDNELGPTAKDNLNKSVDKLDFNGGEIWIGKFDKYMHKVTFGVSESDDKGSFGIDFTFSLKDHNKPVNIEEPKEFMTTKELEEKIQGMFAKQYNDSLPLY